MTETKSAEIFAKEAHAKRIERVTDKLGRILGFKDLTRSQKNHIDEMSPGLDGLSIVKIKDPDGVMQELDVPKRMDLYLAAMLREIDGHPITFPRNRTELDAVLDGLYDEGLNAALEAFAKLKSDDQTAPSGDILEQAKN